MSTHPERILVVEDDLRLARATKRAIEESPGHEVSLAHDVRQGQELVRTERWDAIVCDFELPDGTGADVLACALAVAPETPRILVTSHTEWSTAARSINEGEVFRVVAKPWSDVGLRGVVEQALELKRLRDGRRELKQLADRYQRELAVSNERLRIQNGALDREVQRRTNDFLAAIVSAADLRARGVSTRSQRVAALARSLGEALCLTGDALEDLTYAALLHGIGAIGARDILVDGSSPRLAEAERGRLPELGYAILSRVSFLRGAAKLVREQGERYDGHGTPHGLSAERIAIGARILAVAIRYDELLASHPSIDEPAHDAACKALQTEAGKTLDPQVVGTLLGHPFSRWRPAFATAQVAA